MATLVLTVVGGIVGGPVGAAIGAVIGQAVDRDVLFKPPGRQGPRLTELAVQTSTYGSAIQKIYGTMRIAGVVIWSTELIESQSTSSQGKGQPSLTSYSYAVSFAVALSGRRVLGVGRIWADGKLLRGAAGDFKTATGFRLHLGDEAQDADPLIAAAEGTDLTPAHRGIAYAVFENFQLADYGNRIPSLTFEVIGDVGPVSAGAVAADLSGGVIDGAATSLALAGFAASGDSVRGAVEALAGAAGAWFSPGDGSVAMTTGVAEAVAIGDDGVAVEDDAAGGRRRSVAAIETVPRALSVVHYDPARDYQTGVQRAQRPGPGVREERVEIPAALSADGAKAIAEATLARAEAERERRGVALGWSVLALRPGASVTIAGTAGRWRVSGWSLEHMVLTLDCVRLARGTVAAPASPGRSLPAPDMLPGTTIVHAFELPALDDSLLSAPRLTIAAAGTEPGWRRAALLYSLDDGVRWTAIGSTAAPATIGTLAGALDAGPATIADRVASLEVVLAHDAMALSGADDGALDGGANLALVGDELVQFGLAEQIGPARWRLSRLWRGRRGTEAAIGTQAIGDRFVLIEADALTGVDLPLSALGTSARVMASGIGDSAGPAMAETAISGASVVPPSPVAVRVAEAGGGDATVGWTRRSRAGWRWIDGADAPLGEEREAYHVTIAPASGAPRTVETGIPTATVTTADRAGGPVAVTIRQAGSYGESPGASAMASG